MRTSGGVFVTGASSGIGFAIAQDLARSGFRAFGSVRRDADAAALQQAGVQPVRMDVTDTTSIAAARSEIARALGADSLVGLVNNAGIPAPGPLEYLPLEQLRRVLEVNLVGVVAVTQAFLPLLRAGQGRIVNISSLAGLLALPFMGPYAASKFGLEAVSDSLRRELWGSGVDVIVVEPGVVQSRIWDKVRQLDISPYRGTVYAPIMERMRERALRGAEHGLPARAIARAVHRALTARRPPARMLVSQNWLAVRLARLLPDRLVDRLIAFRLWRPRPRPVST